MSYGNNRGLLANLLKFTIFALLAITFAVALAPSATSADPDPGLVFKDDFSNPDSGWSTKKLNSGSFQYDNGNYVITIGTTGMHNYSKNQNIRALRDLIVEVDVIMEAGGAEDYAELVAGWVITQPQFLSPEESRPGNYYFHIFPVEETANIYTWEQAQWGRANKNVGLLLPRTQYTAVHAGKQNNNLRFVFKGNRLKAFLNNKLMVDTTDENILFGHRLMDLGIVEGKYIYLGAGKESRLEKAVVRFDNFKLYRGTQKAFLIPEELKDSTLLKERMKAAEDYGFDIGSIEYYGNTSDYTQSITKLKAAQPVAIQVMCQPGERSKMEAGLTGYTGEAVYDEVSLTDFALSEITITNSEQLNISLTAKNTGYLPIKQLSCNYAASDVNGNVFFSGKSEILDLPVGKDRHIEIVQGIPFLGANGDYKLKVVISTPDTGNSGQAITREKESAFSISGMSSGIITGIVVSVIVLLGIAAAVFFVINRKSKKKSSA